MQISLEGQRALVTGAGRGLGRATAKALAASGASVIAVSRTAEDLDSLAEETEGRVEGWRADVLDNAFYAEVAALPRLDILVNNAGGNRPMPFTEVDDETLDHLLTLNVRAVFKTAQAAARVMVAQGSGVIVNMSSQMGHVGSPRRSVYCMTKHAVEGLTKALAVELGPKGVRVVSIAPTFVMTPMTKPMFENKEFADFVYGMIPLGRIASLEEVADSIVYLCSSAAGMVTGSSLLVDGGWTAE